MADKIQSLNGLLQALADAAHDQERVSMGEVIQAAGSRSLGPLLLLAGLITLAPIVGDVPGVPTLMALFVLLVALQLIFSHRRPWFPNWLLRRSISSESMEKVLGWMKRPANFTDRYTHRRLTALVEGNGRYLIAAVCIGISLTMPLMEVVPFSANGAGLALSAFGLALISRDGALALVAFTVVSLLAGVLIYNVI